MTQPLSDADKKRIDEFFSTMKQKVTAREIESHDGQFSMFNRLHDRLIHIYSTTDVEPNETVAYLNTEWQKLITEAKLQIWDEDFLESVISGKMVDSRESIIDANFTSGSISGLKQAHYPYNPYGLYTNIQDYNEQSRLEALEHKIIQEAAEKQRIQNQMAQRQHAVAAPQKKKGFFG